MDCFLLVFIGAGSIVVASVGDDLDSFMDSGNISQFLVCEKLYSRWSKNTEQTLGRGKTLNKDKVSIDLWGRKTLINSCIKDYVVKNGNGILRKETRLYESTEKGHLLGMR